MADMNAESGGGQVIQPNGMSKHLIRGMGFFAVMAFGAQCISFSSGQIPFSTIAGLLPGSNLTILLAVAVLFSLFQVYTYAVIGTAAPRSGADYFVASRVLGLPLAFASSWAFVIFSGLAAGSIIADIPQRVVPMFASILALVLRNQQWETIGASLASPENSMVIGTVCIVLMFTGLILSQKVIVRVMQIGFILGAAAWGVICVQLLTGSPAAFPEAWNSLMGSSSYVDHLVEARALGMEVSYAPGMTIIAGMMLGSLIFFGSSISTFFAGEVKQPEKNLLAGGLAALLVMGISFIAATYLLSRLVPSEWLAAESFLVQSAGFDGLAIPSIVFYAAVFKPSAPLILAIGIAWIITLITLAQAFIFYASRIMLAWADDGLLPGNMGYVHPSMGSPLITLLAVAIVAVLGLLLSALQNSIASELNFVFFVVVAQLIPVLAITLFPFLRKDWYESSSRLVRLKIGPVPVITLIGLITLVYLIWLIAANLMYPVLGGVNVGTVTLFGILFASGLLWYFLRKNEVRRLAGDSHLSMVEKPIV